MVQREMNTWVISVLTQPSQVADSEPNFPAWDELYNKEVARSLHRRRRGSGSVGLKGNHGPYCGNP